MIEVYHLTDGQQVWTHCNMYYKSNIEQLDLNWQNI